MIPMHVPDAEARTLKAELEEARAVMRAAALRLRIAYAACGNRNIRDTLHAVAQQLDPQP